ncbi:MAG: MaoC family dehydratase [Nitrospinota bacterium]
MAKPLYFEEVKVGDATEPLVMGPLTRTQIVKYAGASRDFNPNHHDEVYARAHGNKSVFAMGMLPGGYCARLLTEWFGDGALRRLRLRFISRAWPGDVLTCAARITRKYEDGADARVECEFSATNQQGETMIQGDATASLPRRGT